MPELRKQRTWNKTERVKIGLLDAPKKRTREEYDDRSVILTNIENRPWVDEALCVGLPPYWWDVDIPGDTESEEFGAVSVAERTARNKVAMTYCAECPVAQQCLDDALSDPYRNGIYAGYDIRAESPRYRVGGNS